MSVIKGYVDCAHHILAAKQEQMFCLWDPEGMIKDHQSQVMSERLCSFSFVWKSNKDANKSVGLNYSR